MQARQWPAHLSRAHCSVRVIIKWFEVCLLSERRFAVLLKYFQLMARFPDSPEDLPEIILSYLPNQLNIPLESYSDYNWRIFIHEKIKSMKWLPSI